MSSPQPADQPEGCAAPALEPEPEPTVEELAGCEVAVLALQPGDVVLLMIDDVLTPGRVSFAKHWVQTNICPGHRVEVLDQGRRLAVVRPAPKSSS